MYIRNLNCTTTGFSSGSLLPLEISLNEYEQTFSYMRWHKYKEQLIVSSTPYVLHNEIRRVADV